MRTGCPWRDLAAAFGKFQTVYKCFNRLSKQGIFQGFFKKLSADADKKWIMMDGSYVRAHQHAAGAAVCSGEDEHAIGISSQLCFPDPSIGETKLGFYTLCGSVSSVFLRLAR